MKNENINVHLLFSEKQHLFGVFLHKVSILTISTTINLEKREWKRTIQRSPERDGETGRQRDRETNRKRERTECKCVRKVKQNEYTKYSEATE